jgi:hypothetical protein
MRNSGWSHFRRLSSLASNIEDTNLGYPVLRASDPLAAARALATSGQIDVAVVQLGDLGELCRIFLAAGIRTLVYLHDVYSAPTLRGLKPHPKLR